MSKEVKEIEVVEAVKNAETTTEAIETVEEKKPSLIEKSKDFVGKHSKTIKKVAIAGAAIAGVLLLGKAFGKSCDDSECIDVDDYTDVTNDDNSTEDETTENNE